MCDMGHGRGEVTCCHIGPGGSSSKGHYLKRRPSDPTTVSNTKLASPKDVTLQAQHMADQCLLDKALLVCILSQALFVSFADSLGQSLLPSKHTCERAMRHSTSRSSHCIVLHDGLSTGSTVLKFVNRYSQGLLLIVFNGDNNKHKDNRKK